ncbi:bacterial alpha-L-rhamnosidase domain-containing protein [Sphaerosporella brunnea]|uniref:Bacterial alpha-L-rhamnosidase domain-containing protein n=1 Tax=Sphaerosporella brunnea TaxID=1250544 RepID=A0A5J5F8Q1_9PEZI|nr:bacterial alpha-L-rhamnosidase domain-containing protein [Sphaerosporella brunnea]
MPASQTVQRKTTVAFNQKFTPIAESCKPQLSEWIERPVEVITFVPYPSTWFQCRAVHRMSIDELATTPIGKRDEFILDFQTHRVGYLAFHLDGTGKSIDAPARLRLTFGEVPLDLATDGLGACKSWISTSWLPDEVINVDWLPTDVAMHRRYAFRYVRIQIIDTSQQYRAFFSDLIVRAVSSVHPRVFNSIPPLKTSDPLLQKTDLISQHGPRRDRRLWSEDHRLQALTNHATFKDFNLDKGCLYIFAAVVGSDGSLPACLFEFPSLCAASYYIVDYDALFGVMVYDYTIAPSDFDTARELCPTVLGSLKTALCHVKSVEIPRLGSLPSSGCRYAWAPLVLSEAAATKAFYDSSTGVFVSGPQRQVSWLSQAWLALAGVLPLERCKQLLLTAMSDPAALKPLFPYGWTTFAEALPVCGAREECLSLLKSYWGGMVERGADTFWECFDPEDNRKSPYQDFRNNSYCHAWSCSPAWLLRSVLSS